MAKRIKKESIHLTVDKTVMLTLTMLGFDIKALIREMLSKVSGLKRCPTCGREVRPVITGRKVTDSDKTAQ